MRNIIFYLVFLVLIVAMGFIGYTYMQQRSYAHITTYEECAKAGYPILESYPPRCMTPDGKSFTGPGSITIPPTNSPETSDSPAMKGAKKDLANRLSLATSEISVKEARIKEWSDGCLGLGKANEICIQAITPGYEFVLSAKGKEYTYRTDQTGSVVRIEE